MTLTRDAFRRGTAIEGRASIEKSGGLLSRPVRHFISLQVARPDGQAVRYLAQTLETRGGATAFRIPLALNEPTGLYLLTFRDIASGARLEARARVE